MHRLVARLALVTHVCFVAFAILGGLLAFLLPWVLIPHVLSALWGARMAIFKPRCPLSAVEDWGRAGAGRPPLHERGFIAHYAEGRLYPASWGTRIVLAVTALVIGSWVGLAMR